MNALLSHPHSARCRLASTALSVLLATTVGCEDPNKMFEGVWQAEKTLSVTAPGVDVVGTPVLAIGHFGLDLTGLVYFQPAPGTYASNCPCALIKQDIGDTIDFDGRQISFISSCLENFEANTGARTFSNNALSWSLTMGEEEPDPGARSLWGQVQVKPDGEPIDVEFKRVRLSVPADYKECPPEDGEWCPDGDNCGPEEPQDVGTGQDTSAEGESDSGPDQEVGSDAASDQQLDSE